MERFEQPAANFGNRIEKMPYIMVTGRIIFASAFILSAWKEFQGFDLNGKIAIDELQPKLGFFANQANYIIGLGIFMKVVGGFLFIFNTYVGAFLLLTYQAIFSLIMYDFYNQDYDKDHFSFFYAKFKALVNEITSADEGGAMSLYNSMINEESRQKLLYQLDEITKLAISNPLFTPSEFNTLFLKFIKGVGIAAALVVFIALKHKHGLLRNSANQNR